MFEDTHCQADFYLDDTGYEVAREQFLWDNEQWHGHMLYIGCGFCPLRVAVLTCNARGFHGPDWSGALATVEEWAQRKWGYSIDEVVIENIPTYNQGDKCTTT